MQGSGRHLHGGGWVGVVWILEVEKAESLLALGSEPHAPASSRHGG